MNNGTSQIQGISSNLDRLCRELGFNEITSDPRQPQPGAQLNIVNDIRQLVAGMKARDQNFTALQAAVHSLLEVLTTSETQKGIGLFCLCRRVKCNKSWLLIFYHRRSANNGGPDGSTTPQSGSATQSVYRWYVQVLHDVCRGQ